MQDVEAPPLITITRLQKELDSLMADYDTFDQRRSQKNIEAAFGVLLLLFVGGILCSFAIREGNAPLILTILAGGAVFARSAFRYRRERRLTLSALDRTLSLLGPQLRSADRLSMRWEHRNRLHNRLFNELPEVAQSIIPVLEVTGDKESLDFLWSLAGKGTYGNLLAWSLSPEIRLQAATSAKLLQRKLERETAARTLLRPTGSASEKELLRPAGISGTAEPEMLLRAETAGLEEPAD